MAQLLEYLLVEEETPQISGPSGEAPESLNMAHNVINAVTVNPDASGANYRENPATSGGTDPTEFQLATVFKVLKTHKVKSILNCYI